MDLLFIKKNIYIYFGGSVFKINFSTLGRGNFLSFQRTKKKRRIKKRERDIDVINLTVQNFDINIVNSFFCYF